MNIYLDLVWHEHFYKQNLDFLHSSFSVKIDNWTVSYYKTKLI